MAQRLRTGRSAVLRWLESSAAELGQHTERLNAINVFPVADADTGNNLYRTARAAADAVAGAQTHDLGELVTLAGRAGLVGAHGNSGTLLGVVLLGLGAAWRGEPRLSAPSLASGLEAARTQAWAALSDPVPGTMLSVLEDAADAASFAAGAASTRGDDAEEALAGVLDAVVSRAQRAVEGTEEQLGALREAKVVDAGAVGMLLVLECLRCAVLEAPVNQDRYDSLHGYGTGAPRAAALAAREEGVEVMCTVVAEPLDAATLRAHLDSVGDSVVMSPLEQLGEAWRWRVHVHVSEASVALDVISAVGEPSDLAVTDLCTHPHE